MAGIHNKFKSTVDKSYGKHVVITHFEIKLIKKSQTARKYKGYLSAYCNMWLKIATVSELLTAEQQREN